MKIIFLLLIGSVSQAYEGFFCIPSGRDSRFQVLVQNNEIQATVTNPMGYEFMPQFDGPSSAFSISFLKMQGNDLKDLGHQFSYSWPKEACQIDLNQYKVSCRREAKKQVQSIKSFGLTTSEITEKYEDQIYEKRKFRFSLENENTYFVTLQFDLKSCGTFK